jgi:hypothetical protein
MVRRGRRKIRREEKGNDGIPGGERRESDAQRPCAWMD